MLPEHDQATVTGDVQNLQIYFNSAGWVMGRPSSNPASATYINDSLLQQV